MKEYFSFKRLSKKRKISFIIQNVCSAIQFICGIYRGNLLLILFAMYVFITTLDLFNDQSTDIIIENYRNMIETQFKVHRETLNMISKAIKSGDEDTLKQIDFIINTNRREEVDNDSN